MGMQPVVNATSGCEYHESGLSFSTQHQRTVVYYKDKEYQRVEASDRELLSYSYTQVICTFANCL